MTPFRTFCLLRNLLSAVLLAAIIAIGAAVSDFVWGTLAAAGVHPTLFAFTAAPAKAPEAGHSEGDGRSHEGAEEGRGRARPRKPRQARARWARA
ncbi:hypothetical protein JCM2811A_51910 [Methylorubrum rhodinum]